jgi:AsmA protein
MAGVQAQPVLISFAHFKKLSGTADADVSVTAAGESQKALVSSLNGAGNVIFRNGSLEGIDLAKIAKLLQSRFTQMDAGEGATEFVEMGGTLKIASGVAANDDFHLKGPLVQATGKGTIDLPQKYVQYRMLPALVLSSGSAGGLSVPVDIKGPFTNVKIVPDYGSVIQNAIKDPSQIKSVVKDVKPMIKDIRKDPLGALGGILGVPPAQQPEAAAPGAAAPQAEAVPPAPAAPAAPAPEAPATAPPASAQPAPAPQ